MRVAAVPLTILAALCLTSGLNCQRRATPILGCSDPTPNEPDWWKTTWQRHADGSATGTTPEPPQLRKDLEIERWSGRYRLTVVATAGTSHRDTVSGTITLWVPTDSNELHPALVGVTDSSFRFSYGAALAHPTWQRDPKRPGISLHYDLANGKITLVFGNGDLNMTDSGVFLDVFSIDGDTMRGRWVDGGLGVLVDSLGHSLGHPQGYFCLGRFS